LNSSQSSCSVADCAMRCNCTHQDSKHEDCAVQTDVLTTRRGCHILRLSTVCSVSNIHTQVVKHAAHWMQVVMRGCHGQRLLIVCSVSNIYTFKLNSMQLIGCMQVIRRGYHGLRSRKLQGLQSMPLRRMAQQASSICTRPRKLCCLLTSFLS